MAPFLNIARAALVGMLALSFLGSGSRASAQQACTPIPNMTIQIFNPASNTYNLYPILTAGAKSDIDSWMQSCFQLTTKQVNSGNYPYPRAGLPRFYINCCAPGENGIPPGGSVTVTLPLYSPLVANIDPTDASPPGQFADWWQGGHIEIFANLQSAASPPGALLLEYGSEFTPLPLYSNSPTCVGQMTTCTLHFYFDTVSTANSAPQQLLEYTLGAVPINPKNNQAGQPHFLFVANNVDYDVSYVNNAFLPATMEPYGNKLIGWIGAANTIDGFKTAMANFLAAPNYGSGWPIYAGTESTPKIASALEIFLNPTAPIFNPPPSQSPPVLKMMSLWETCVLDNTISDPICPGIVDATNLLYENYKNYRKKFASQKSWNCTGTPQGPANGQPSLATEQMYLAHLYAWGPFNYNCAADANQLYDTPEYNTPNSKPSYQTVKNEFDELQYWKNFNQPGGVYGLFDPFVGLIHGEGVMGDPNLPPYIGAPYTYAYSVDDAVGNMQTDGSGLIIEVGGTGDLPNPDHATPNVNVNYGYSSPGYGVAFVEYGRCTPTPDTTTNPNFASFAVPLGIGGNPSSITNCLITFRDDDKDSAHPNGRIYQFKIKRQPAPQPWGNNPAGDKAERDLIDCTGNTGQVLNWCKAAYAYQGISDDAHRTNVYYVILQGPPPKD